MTARERNQLRAKVDQAKRRQIARAHGREIEQQEDWTDDPGYVGDRPRRDRRRHAHRPDYDGSSDGTGTRADTGRSKGRGLHGLCDAPSALPLPRENGSADVLRELQRSTVATSSSAPDPPVTDPLAWITEARQKAGL